MAVQRFRTIEEMAAAAVVVPSGDGFERFARHCARYSVPPAVCPSEQAALQAVRDNPGGVAYISESYSWGRA